MEDLSHKEGRIMTGDQREDRPAAHRVKTKLEDLGLARMADGTAHGSSLNGNLEYSEYLGP